jgi:hypothetical protein
MGAGAGAGACTGTGAGAGGFFSGDFDLENILPEVDLVSDSDADWSKLKKR